MLLDEAIETVPLMVGRVACVPALVGLIPVEDSEDTCHDQSCSVL